MKDKPIGPNTPLTLPSVVDTPRWFIAHMSIALLLMQELKLLVRLIDDGAPALLKQPLLAHHDAERCVPHSVISRASKYLGKHTDWRLAEADTVVATTDVAIRPEERALPDD